ncbi:hypothetical protein O0L34_g11408 [Tuta absoluta]|nr:hypothetical protein O0L34_g11408 [Tuta absoluta]
MMLWFAAVCWLAALRVTAAQAEDYANNESVQLFQEYLRINTTTHGNLSEAVEFWRARAAEENVDMCVHEFTPGYPVIVLRWPGADSSSTSIMLNSHMDVVPANENEGWTYPPFEAHMDEEGVIYGRGTQDMKSISIQYFEALKKIKANNVTLLRDVYMTLMPDEEVGAENGMIPFLASEEFRALNVGLELDEGAAFPLPISPVFYQDKVVWQIQVDCYGESAHSSTFPPINQTAMGRCIRVINRMMEFREEEFVKYSTLGGTMNAGAYTSVNLNIINAGTAANVIAGHVTLVFDIRPGIAVDEDTFDRQLREWIEGDNVTMTYILQNAQSPATLVTEDNPYWTTFQQAAQTMGQGVLAIVPPGSTDARFVRGAGFPALGYAPMPNTASLLHMVNERLSAETFLRGIEIYETLITSLANIPDDRLAASPSAYVVSTTQA